MIFCFFGLKSIFKDSENSSYPFHLMNSRSYYKAMEPFHSVRKTLTILGINQNRHSFIEKILIAQYVYCSSSILSCVFFFTEVESFREYTDSIYTLTAFIAVTLCFTHIIIQMRKLFQYINDCTLIVNYSEWFIFYFVRRSFVV